MASRAKNPATGDVLSGRGREMDFSALGRTVIMGILNLTPDSFSDAGSYGTQDLAFNRAEQMRADGADIIDVGGESTRPGAVAVDEAQEARRVLPVVRALCKEGFNVSVDTSKAGVAKMALDAGAWMINDVSALRDPLMAGVLAEFDAPVVLMHMRGTPKDMQADVYYDNLMEEIVSFLSRRIEYAIEQGVRPCQIAVDPGIGFGKSAQGNFTILAELKRLKSLGRPVLVGASRKGFLKQADPMVLSSDRASATVSAHTAAILNGADMIRVHDVKEAVRGARIARAVRNASSS